MNKVLLIISCILITTCLFAQDYFPAKVIMTNGIEKPGFIEDVTMTDKTVLFRLDKNGETEEIQSDEVKTVIYYNPDGKIMFEFDRIKAYENSFKKRKVATKCWLIVISRDYLTLYYGATIGTKIRYSDGTSQIFNLPDKLWFAYRQGEEAAMLISCTFSGNIIPNSIFKRQGQIYFSDYPELAKKIKDKIYTWKSIETVVNEYNEWYRNKVKKPFILISGN